MAHVLDQEQKYQTTSRQLVLSSLRSLGRQARQGYRDARSIRFPRRYHSAEQLAVCGMGGSALGTDVLRSVFSSVLKVPLTIVNDYVLPRSVGKKTLVVLSSYSGSTEEVLAAARQARQRKAMITGLTTGGPLGAMLQRWRIPWYRIDGQANPAGQPRLGLGYSACGQLGLLTALGLVMVTSKEVSALAQALEERTARLDPRLAKKRNLAKRLAAELNGGTPVLVGAEHLTGSMHVFANQLNETAKTFAVSFSLPELNHHLLEGLRYPTSLRYGVWLFVNSSRYSQPIRQRQNITKQIVERRGIATATVSIRGSSALVEAFDLITIAGFVSFYLSVLHNVDPMTVPSVDELKRRLGQR